MYVKEIVIDGFKSYAKRTVVGSWDTQFNCITGLNGSGKSNILDAICFVLGITTMSTVRASNQQDLIYKRGQAGVTKASVSIVFDNSDKSRSPLDYKEVDTITVTRQVVLGGTSKYLVNGHRAQQNQVQNLFQEVQLNVNNPNFLIMQGQITKVVNMQPKEILSLIEEAAGTGLYEKERQKAVKEMRNREGDLRESETLAEEEVRPRLEEMREKKRIFLEYQQCANANDATEKIVAASEYALCSAKLRDLVELAENRAARTEELKARIELEISKQAEVEQRRERLKQQQKSAQSQKLETELQAANEEQTRISGELEHKQEQLANIETELATESETVNRVTNELDSHNTSVMAFENHHDRLQAELDTQRQVVVEKRELLTGLETGISTTGERETGFAYTTKRAREALKEAQTQLASLQSEHEQLTKRLGSQQQQHADVSQQIKAGERKLEEITASEHAKQQQYESIKATSAEMQQLRTERQGLRDTVSSVSRELELLMAKYPNLDIPIDRRDPNWSHVKGRVAHAFQVRPEHEDKLLALESCAGGALWNLVVDNDKVGAAVLKHSRKRMTVLPLNRLRPQTLNSQMIQQIDPHEAWLASDLLSFSDEVRPAVEHVFGRTVICKTDKIANRAAFEFKVRAVTLQGDLFEPRGIISGGFNKRDANGSLTIFASVKKYQQLAEQHLQCEQRLDQVDAEISRVGQSALLADRTKNELDLLHHEVELLRTNLSGLQEKLAEIEQGGTQVQNLEQKIPEIQQLVEQKAAALEQTTKDAAEFSSNREGKLRQLRQDVEREVEHEQQLAAQLDQQSAEHSRNQFELAKLKADLSQATDARDRARRDHSELSSAVSVLTEQSQEISAKVTGIDTQLREELERLSSVRTEVQAVEEQSEQLRASIAETKRELQHSSHSLESGEESMRTARQALAQVTKRWSWAQSVAESPGAELVSGNELEQQRQTLVQNQRRIQELSQRVDSGVLGQIQRLEQEEATVRGRIAQIKQDKRKMEELMQTLSDRRRDKISAVWQQVSHDFGLIFGDLLPGSTCELVPVDDQPIERGFSIKVRLGGTWKEGLTELSGGQRSLVALSLILALLRYHPAPVYILDEVDAALDVHHTSNIGHIIKTRFKNAQFIVVSLKDDMFTNANRIYQTRFVDGTSTVAIAA